MPKDRYAPHGVVDGTITLEDHELLPGEWPLREAQAITTLLLLAWEARDERHPQALYEAIVMIATRLDEALDEVRSTRECIRRRIPRERGASA
jgi:hypothetical protein